MRRTVDQCPADIVLAPSGCPLTNLEYADDVVIFAESSTTLQHVVNLVSKQGVCRVQAGKGHLAENGSCGLKRIRNSDEWIDSVRALTENQEGWAELYRGRHILAKMRAIASGNEISPPIKSLIPQQSTISEPFVRFLLDFNEGSSPVRVKPRRVRRVSKHQIDDDVGIQPKQIW
ncbi:hypothetical protein RB195_010181 [Necator americanus]|uniref:Reverse transcriptase domain-containing protein n=1 Tax=Necator americanus TaxID=51031 RepID=A0ABR1CY69_NECAM